jgi:hypothetical protein
MSLLPDVGCIAIKIAKFVWKAISTAETSTEGSDSKEKFALILIKKMFDGNGLTSQLNVAFTPEQTDSIIQLLIKFLVSVLNDQVGQDWIDVISKIKSGTLPK